MQLNNSCFEWFKLLLYRLDIFKKVESQYVTLSANFLNLSGIYNGGKKQYGTSKY